MSRSSRNEQAAFSLFPFLAVLLCTMGAMVVLLVAMAYVSRNKAQQQAEAAAAQAEAAAAKLAADSPERRTLEEKIAAAQATLERARSAHTKGEQLLAEEQQRLSDIEGHVERLRLEAEKLKAEAAQLFAVEQEHYDDEKIAQKELERLNDLIGDLQDELDEMKHAAAGRERRYAVVPLRDARTGTVRPATYFECGADGVTIQPEGILLPWEDLVAPQFSSPLSAAVRVISRYYEENPEARAANEVGKPYPLLIVRPDGVGAYYRSRDSLENFGGDYGYQPVAADWPLEYGEPNPVLAHRIEEALRTARAERVGMSRVVPQLATAMANAGVQETQVSGAFVASGGGATAAAGSGMRVSRADPDANNPFEGLHFTGTLPNEMAGHGQSGESESGRGSDPTSLASGGGPGQLQGGPDSSYDFNGALTNETSPESEQDPPSQAPNGSQLAGTASQTNANRSQGGSGSPNGSQSGNAAAIASGSPASSSSNNRAGGTQSSRARDGLPIVRPIRLYVTEGRVALVPDRGLSPAEAASLGSTNAVDFPGGTSEHINDLISVLKKHADSWGIAGDGMYWDPRMTLSVAPDGNLRADEVRRLLEAADFKVHLVPATTAVYPTTEGSGNATRR